MEKKSNEFEEVEKAEVKFEEVKKEEKKVRTDSYFDGGLIELIGWKLLAFIITLVTLGFAWPWAKCMIYSYQIKHTVYNGKRLKFVGTGGDLFVNNFKWVLLSIITFGIYAFFIPVKKTKWVISNIYFEDEECVTGESFFDGKTIQLIGVNIVCNLLNLISFGLLYSFTCCFKLKWINKHTVINRKKLVFNGKAIGLFGKYILWVFLTTITFGIYGLWLPIKILKWQTTHTHIKVVGETEEKDTSLYIAIPVAIVGISLFVLMLTLIPNLFKEFNIDNPFFGGSGNFGASESIDDNIINSSASSAVSSSASSVSPNIDSPNSVSTSTCPSGYFYDDYYNTCATNVKMSSYECMNSGGNPFTDFDGVDWCTLYM